MRRCSPQSIRLAMGRRFLSLRPWMSGRKRICSWMSGARSSSFMICVIRARVTRPRRANQTFSDRGTPAQEGADRGIPRIARLLALAIRLEGLLREEPIRDYAELARLGGVTRARMTQIMKLLDLAPDIQEQILFLPLIQGLNERNLRPI